MLTSALELAEQQLSVDTKLLQDKHALQLAHATLASRHESLEREHAACGADVQGLADLRSAHASLEAEHQTLKQVHASLSILRCSALRHMQRSLSAYMQRRQAHAALSILRAQSAEQESASQALLEDAREALSKMTAESTLMENSVALLREEQGALIAEMGRLTAQMALCEEEREAHESVCA
jgi:hypothetical protein